MAEKQAAGALAASPKKYKYTLKQLEKRQAAGIPLGQRQVGRLQRAGRIAPSQATPTEQLTPQQIEQRIGAETGAGAGQFMDIIQQQGAFQPGSFQEQMDAAYQNVMKQYEQTMGPELAREQANFQQMAAERGLDPNSEAYKTLQSQLNQRQDLARQGAMQAGLQAAQGVQAQGFGQALQGYQAPAQMLQAFTPYYNIFGQRMGEQEQLDLANRQLAQDWQKAQLAAQTGITQAQYGATGALTYPQQLELIKNKYLLEGGLKAMPSGDQPRYPGAGAGFASGLGTGIGAGITKAVF